VDRELQEYLNHTADTPMGALRLSSYWQSNGNRELALQLARRAPGFDQYNPDAFRLAAIQLNSLGDNPGARAMFDRGLALDPQNAVLHFNMGLLHAEMGQSGQALQSFRNAVRFNPQMEDAWYNLVVFYWQLGDLEKARQELTRALTDNPQSPRLLQLARQLPPAQTP